MYIVTLHSSPLLHIGRIGSVQNGSNAVGRNRILKYVVDLLHKGNIPGRYELAIEDIEVYLTPKHRPRDL